MKKLTEWLVKDLIEEDIEIPVNVGDTISVSYTHLTLPTKRIV